MYRVFTIATIFLSAALLTGAQQTEQKTAPDATKPLTAPFNETYQEAKKSITEPVKRPGGSVSSPKLLSAPEAEYTDYARRKKIQGIVLVQLIVDTCGLPQNPHVIKHLDPTLDEEAIKAIQQYRFVPSQENGIPVPVMITVALHFYLRAPRISALHDSLSVQ
jgi:TonB family protein